MGKEMTDLFAALDAEPDRTFLEAAMGASALMAWADQDISWHETSARDFCLDHVSQLKRVNP